VVQLEHALRGILTNSIRPGLHGNCVSEDQEEEDSKICPLGTISLLKDSTIEEEPDEIPDLPFERLTLYVSNVVVYMAGFVGRSVAQKIKCPSCIISLLAKDMDTTKLRSDFVLINEKNNGGLYIPSPDVIEVCRITESEVRRSIASGIPRVNRKDILKATIRFCNSASLFLELRQENSKEHPLFSDHVLNLIQKIANRYLTIRLYHLGKATTLSMRPVTNRSKCTKLVQFSGN
jgi:hypothetical protein